jgi:hypothetical protein
LKHWFTEINGEEILKSSRIQVSYGDLPLPADIDVVKLEDGLLPFTWGYKM